MAPRSSGGYTPRPSDNGSGEFFPPGAVDQDYIGYRSEQPTDGYASYSENDNLSHQPTSTTPLCSSYYEYDHSGPPRPSDNGSGQSFPAGAVGQDYIGYRSEQSMGGYTSYSEDENLSHQPTFTTPLPSSYYEHVDETPSAYSQDSSSQLSYDTTSHWHNSESTTGTFSHYQHLGHFPNQSYDTSRSYGGQNTRVGKVWRNRSPIHTIQKTIERPGGTLSNSSRERLKRQAALSHSLDSSFPTISLRPPGVETPAKLYHYTTEDGKIVFFLSCD